MNIIGKVNKIMQTSEGMIKINRALDFKIIIQVRIHKSLVNASLNCDGILILWRKHYSKIAHDRYYKHNQHCRESHFHDFTNCI